MDLAPVSRPPQGFGEFETEPEAIARKDALLQEKTAKASRMAGSSPKKSAPVTSTTSTASLSPSKEAWAENNDDAPAEEEEPEAEANADEEGKTQVEEQQSGGCVIC